jgi:hypothetical protein
MLGLLLPCWLQVISVDIAECVNSLRQAATGVNNRSGYRGVRRVGARVLHPLYF